MQTHRRPNASQSLRSVGLFWHQLSDLSNPQEILLYSWFSRIFIFLLSHYYFHTCYRQPSGLTFLFTCVSPSLDSQAVCAWKGLYCWRGMENSSPFSSSAIIYYLSYTAHIFIYLPLAAVLNELFTLCWIMYHLVHKQRSLHTVPRWGGQEVIQYSGGMRHYGTLWTSWSTSWELALRECWSINGWNMRLADSSSSKS